MTTADPTPVENSRRENGFSLLEAVMVMAIMAAIAGICVPRYAMALDRYRLDLAARRVEVDLALCRDKALAMSKPVTIAFSAGSSKYTIIGFDDPQRPGAVYAVQLADQPYGAVVKSVDFNGAGVLAFNGHAVPDHGGQVVLSRGKAERIIFVDSMTSEDVLD